MRTHFIVALSFVISFKLFIALFLQGVSQLLYNLHVQSANITTQNRIRYFQCKSNHNIAVMKVLAREYSTLFQELLHQIYD